MSHEKNIIVLPAADLDGLRAMPGVLDFHQAFPFLNLNSESALRRQFERGTLSVRVVAQGGRLAILKNDLQKFLQDGRKQDQEPLQKRAARNIFGPLGDPAKRKRGRPTNASRTQRNGGAAC